MDEMDNENIVHIHYGMSVSCEEKQKEGKKRMRQVGSVEVPSEAFMSVLKLDNEKK